MNPYLILILDWIMTAERGSKDLIDSFFIHI